MGRGCLAGPVVAGAVLLLSEEIVSELTDSKLLSEQRREKLSPQIETHHLVGIGFATPEEIDELNILQASLLAMKRAAEALEVKWGGTPGHLLIDGTFKIPGVLVPQKTFIQGDLRVAPISAASIVAKVFRDRWMKQLGQEFPNYGFEKHKGYASSMHREAIAKWGPTPWHRRSFRGVREYCLGPSSENERQKSGCRG